MKNLFIIILTAFLFANTFAQEKTQIVTVFGSENDRFYYCESTKEIWFYKSDSYEKNFNGKIEQTYEYYWPKHGSIDDQLNEKLIWWGKKDGSEEILTFILPNNENCNKIFLDSNNIWLSTRKNQHKEFKKRKATWNESIEFIEKYYEKWQYQAEKIGPFYFPTKGKRKQFKKRWWNDSYSQKFGFFYPDEFKSWAEKTKKQSFCKEDYKETYRLPIHWNGRYLYLEIINSPLKQTFSSTLTYWDWREAWKLFHKSEWKEKRQTKTIKKFLKKNNFD